MSYPLWDCHILNYDTTTSSPRGQSSRRAHTATSIAYGSTLLATTRVLLLGVKNINYVQYKNTPFLSGNANSSYKSFYSTSFNTMKYKCCKLQSGSMNCKLINLRRTRLAAVRPSFETP